MEDNGQLWSVDDKGDYWLLFPNKQGLSVEEINEVFSTFGDVRTINCAGNEKGFRFIKYSSLQETERAVNNLKGHPAIKLIPHRPKKNQSKGQNDSILSDGSNCSFSSKRLSSDNTNKQFMFNKSNEINEEGRDKDNSETQPSKQKRENKSSPNTAVLNRSFNEVSSSNDVQAMLKKRGEFSNTFSPGIFDKFTTELKKSVQSVEDDLPPLSRVDNKTHKVESKKKIDILDAHEVVVGNIQEEFGSAYILHLLEAWEPLAVTVTKTLPNNPRIRYCYVYLKSSQDAVTIEKNFDRFVLNGKKLIVLRPSQLKAQSLL